MQSASALDSKGMRRAKTFALKFAKHECVSRIFLGTAIPTRRDSESAEISAHYKKSSPRVARVVSVNTLWKQAFATALAPACKSGAAALCSHTCAKTVLVFTRPLRWLISAFHKPWTRSGRSESAYTRGTANIVNDTGWEQLLGANNFVRRRRYPHRARG
jgi:hypothetical protein